MRILLAGASGTLGTALRASLSASGHTVLSLVRRAPIAPHEIFWDPSATQPVASLAPLESLDAALCLSGAGIADQRWRATRKQLLRSSRIIPLQALGRIFSSLQHPPATLLTASGINAYADAADSEITEASPLGSGFLAALCREWESTALALATNSLRVTPMRFGAILTPAGGMIKKLLPIFRLGLGGPIGNGRQYMSWVSITDACRAADFLLATPTLSGPVNVVAPVPVTNAQFTRDFAHALHRPAIFPAPAFTLRLAFGQLADEMLLSSARVLPARLTAAGFHFTHPTLPAALTALLK